MTSFNKFFRASCTVNKKIIEKVQRFYLPIFRNPEPPAFLLNTEAGGKPVRNED